MSKIIGLVGIKLYIEPIYGGDHIHDATVTQDTRADLIQAGVKDFPHYQAMEYHYAQTLHAEIFEHYKPEDNELDVQ